MKLSESVKPISYLKAHASEILRDVAATGKTMIITQNGEAKVILQDVKVYEDLQESLALLKIIAISNKNLEQTNFKPINKSFSDIRAQIKRNKSE